MPSRRANADQYHTPPDLLVASALMSVSHLPSSKRGYAVRALAEHHRSMYAELNEPLPERVQMLSEWADREGST
ncbi:MAG TPA: hypothetical protein VFS20_12980 [Longimicrobium sp.]|nr:hypothetical protein [Longimicrobium sp.]